MSCKRKAKSRRGRAGWRALRAGLAPCLLCLVLAAAACDELFGRDRQPPDCRIVLPADSSAVSGKVTVRAEAYDTSGVKAVEFFVNGASIGSVSSPPYIALWDATGQPDGGWHRLFCLASDAYNNVGSSDTIAVQVKSGGQRDVLHGAFRVEDGGYRQAGFSAVPGDTLAGDFRVLSGRSLSRFIWLDAANFRQFQAGAGYTPLLERLDAAELSLREPVAAADSFYLVFLNAGGGPVELWARFALER